MKRCENCVLTVNEHSKDEAVECLEALSARCFEARITIANLHEALREIPDLEDK